MPTRSSSNPPPFLSLRDATFRLGDRLVFERFSWSFNRDEQWAVIGPNGSGKSIFADALRGLLPLVGGELLYHFQSPEGLSPEQAIGHVSFEDRKQELHGTVVQSRWNSFETDASQLVREFLSYERVMDINPFEVTPRHATARPQFERRLKRALDLLHVRDFLSRTLMSLSNGERQRVQIARALAQPLRLLILDEPYVGLDVASRRDFHRILERLLQTRLKVLLITARTGDLPRHITHLLQLKNCRVTSAGRRDFVLGQTARSGTHRIPVGQRPIPLRGRHPASSRHAPKVVELRNITVRYGQRTILSGVDWDIYQGQSWVLLGPNGSGKTTLLSLINGDNPQAYVNHVVTFGRRRGAGESIWHLKKQIGWVSPELQLHFNESISVMDVVLSGFEETIGVFQGVTPARIAAARRCLKRFDLLASAEMPLVSLSAGLQRMCLLARALVKSPRLLILDEPCQGLDTEHRDHFISYIDSLIRHQDVTAIFVTHRSEEIPASIRCVLRLSPSGRAQIVSR
jgi:molybdate transport system ATP-binding protein